MFTCTGNQRNAKKKKKKKNANVHLLDWQGLKKWVKLRTGGCGSPGTTESPSPLSSAASGAWSEL